MLMKFITKWNKYQTLLVIGAFLLIGSIITVTVWEKNRGLKAAPDYNYTIWVGSPAFGQRHNVDTFYIENNVIRCTENDREKIFPIYSIYKIEQVK